MRSDLTKEMWTPRPWCTAEQSMQRKTPYVTDAHVGFLALQSKHICVAVTTGNYNGEKKHTKTVIE
jgi:hypothetical protein